MILALGREEQYTVDEDLDLIVLGSPQDNNGREAYARYNDVAVFVYPSGLDPFLGTHVCASVSERGDKHLKAVGLAVLGKVIRYHAPLGLLPASDGAARSRVCPSTGRLNEQNLPSRRLMERA